MTKSKPKFEPINGFVLTMKNELWDEFLKKFKQQFGEDIKNNLARITRMKRTDDKSTSYQFIANDRMRAFKMQNNSKWILQQMELKTISAKT